VLKHFGADGKVKQEFPSAISYQPVGLFVRIFGKAGILREFRLEPGEMIGETFQGVITPEQPAASPYTVPKK
jgi:hypothetical protein